VKKEQNALLAKEGKAPLDKERVVSLISDKASAIGNLAIVLGNIIAPLVGGPLVGHFEFRSTADIMSMTCFVLFTFYLICGILLRPKDLTEDE
jgi:hypothetical protein